MLIFAGDQDLICNYVGLESMIQALTWNGATGLGEVETQTWSVDGRPAGTWVASRNLTYVKIFNASHMVGYDSPLVSHDMLLRFMGVNLTSLVDGAAQIPSAIGSDRRPTLVESSPNAPAADTGAVPTKSPEQDKAMWEAYYNAGSAALVLVLIVLAVGVFLWCRVRRARRARGRGKGELALEEEAIPLTHADNEYGIESGHHNARLDPRGKGKARALRSPSPNPAGAREVIFGVGDSDEDEDARSR